METESILQNSDNTVGLHAPEIPDQTGPWFNSNQLKISEVNSQNKIVLVDFWTYSCVNCLRTLPYIKKWNAKYASMGLVIIGVHTPEFEFEKDSKNVSAFIKKEGIDYPVVMDSDYEIWNSFANHYWPRKYLIDTKGIIRLDHAGEGAYKETESTIQSLLKEVSGVSLPSLVEETHHHITQGAVCYPTTAELYAGYLRGIVGNSGGFVQDQIHIYKAPEIDSFEDGKIYLEGDWVSKNEYLVHHRNVEEPTDFVAILYHGLEVNAVMKSASGRLTRVLVQRDGQPLEPTFAGKDVVFDDSGLTYIDVDEPRLYNIIKDGENGKHILKLSPLHEDFQLFAYTFGGCADENK